MNFKKTLQKLGITLVWFLILCCVIMACMSINLPAILVILIVVAACVLLGRLMFKIDGDQSFALGCANFLLAFIFLLIFTTVVPSPFEAWDYPSNDYLHNDDPHKENNSDNHSGSNSDPYIENNDISSDDTMQNDSIYVDGNTYKLSDVDKLNGIFILNENEGTLTAVVSKLSEETISEFNGNSTYRNFTEVGRLCWSDHFPATIYRSTGEKLVLVGTEWSERAASRKEKITFFHNIQFLGYGNYFLDISIGKIETVCDINISQHVKEGKTLEKAAAVNAAISNTPFSFNIYDLDTLDYRLLILSENYNETFRYGYFEGTTYSSANVAMITPYYLYLFDESTVVPIEKTMNGYMVIDISTLPTGTLIINSVTGNYSITIK